jgi:type VII secretion protein EccB
MPQMRSRREQVDAHRFITSRMNQALLLANPDSVERPLRRIGVSIFASVMIMVVIFAGFAIAAVFNKGNEDPTVGSIITVKGTQAIYVYTYADGAEERGEEPKLWPVANYTSALLLLEPYEGDPPVQDLKPESLDGYPRGLPIGITGAPAEPPPAESLLQHENWNACSMPAEEGSKASHMLTQLVVQDLPEPEWLGTDQWLLARTAVGDGEESKLYLLWNDRRYPIEDPETLNVLNLSESAAIPLNEEMLNTIPAGAPLAAEIDENHFNQPSGVSTDEHGTLNYGQTVTADNTNFVLVYDDEHGDEFAEISETERLLLQHATKLDTIEIPAQVKNDTGVQASYGADNFPQDVLEAWTVDPARFAVCGVFDPDLSEDEAKVAIAMYQTAPKAMIDAAASVEISQEGDIVSNVPGQTAQPVLPPGSAALVSSQSSPGQTIQGITYLVDSLGFRYGLVDIGSTGSTKQLLGYGDVDSVGVPDSMLSLIPKGPDLDPTVAKRQQKPGSDEVPVFDTGEDEEAEGGEGE